MQQHKLRIDWREGEIQAWSPDCFVECPSPPCWVSIIESPLPEESCIAEPYREYQVVSSKAQAYGLSPRYPSHCATDLIEVAVPPRGRLFFLSRPEEEAMKTYVQEALKQGIIRPSTSPFASRFFFVAKKDGGL